MSSTITSIEANSAVATLRAIRAGDTNKAIERLEEQLDRAVISVAAICPDAPRPTTEGSHFRRSHVLRSIAISFRALPRVR